MLAGEASITAKICAFARAHHSTYMQEPMQYVICGAGLDSFIFRNKHDNIQIFELDHPDTQKYKIDRIKELGWKVPENAHFVSIDFEKQRMEEVLLEAGFDPKKRTLFAILGVTYYLTMDTFAETLKSIAVLSKADQGIESSANQVVFDYPDKQIVKNGHVNERMEALVDITDSLGEIMRGGMTFAQLAQALDLTGFHISEHMTPDIIQEVYFEERDDDMRAFENISFITAQKNRVL